MFGIYFLFFALQILRQQITLSVNYYTAYNRSKKYYCRLYSSSWLQYHFERSTETQPIALL